jgi:hypothetical protein
MDLGGFDESQLGDQARLGAVRQIAGNFDIIAFQNVQGTESRLGAALADACSQIGRTFDFLVSPISGRAGLRRQFVCLYDSNRITADHRSAYSIQDPDDLLTHEPFVTSFRCLDADPSESFTFSLVNVLLDASPEEAEREVKLMWRIMDSVRADGRGEDDVILLGNFQSSQFVAEIQNLHADAAWAVAKQRQGNAPYRGQMNVLFSRQATVEFSGRSGVLDLVRQFNLTEEQADQISPCDVAWAEFHPNEGGR